MLDCPVLIQGFTSLLSNSIEKHVRDIVHKAFWDKLSEELNEKPPNYNQTMSLISELKEVKN